MKRAVLGASLALACSLAAATSHVNLGSFGSGTNTSDFVQSFMFSGTGDGEYSLTLAAGNYDLDFAAVLKTSLLGTIDSVTFDGQTFTAAAGSFDLMNFTFSVPTDGSVFDFDVATTKSHATPAIHLGHGLTIPAVPATSPSYIGVFAITDVGAPQAAAVPESSSMMMLLAGIGLIGVMYRRKTT